MKLGKKTLFFLCAGGIGISVICLCMAKKVYKKYDLTRIADQQQEIIHTAIIGSGPAGATAATYCERLGLRSVVIKGDKPGGLIADTGYVENWPGSTKILGSEIAENLTKQAESQGAMLLDDSVDRVDFSCWPYKLYTEGGRCIRALSVIIATGSSPKKLGIPGEQEYWGAGVSACAVCDAPLYRDKDVLVIGGGDSAIEEAVLLAQYAQKVTVLVRRGAMRAAQHMQDRLNEYPNIFVQYNMQPQEVVGDQGLVTGLKVLDASANTERFIPAHGIFLAIGHEPNTRLFKDYIELDEATGVIKLFKNSKQTSLEGVFAAGDVERRRRQACVAAGSGAEAALDAKEFLDGIGFTKQVAAQLRLFKPTDMHGVDSFPVLPAADGCVKELFSLADFSREVQDKKGLVCVNVVDDSAATQELVQEVAHDLAGSVAFVTINKNKATDIAERFFVSQAPCRLVFNNGSLVARNGKDMDAQALRDFVVAIADEAAATQQRV